MLEQFHFQQPLWLLALLPLVLLLWRLYRPLAGDNPWQRIVDAHLLPLLMANTAGNNRRLPFWLLTGAWILAVLALADPVWEKQSIPLFQAQQAQVIVLDLSRSMNTADIKPSRLARARFKLLDALKMSEETRSGLVVFAGDAFVVSPLTRDHETIANLVKALDTEIMPVQGSRVDLGLARAAELLQQAGLIQGQVLLIADGYDEERAIEAAAELKQQGYRLSVLGVGTAEGGPLVSRRGQLLRNGAGLTITTRLDDSAMQQLAAAGGGRYASLGSSNSDLDYLLPKQANPFNSQTRETDQQSEQWQSEGPWLVILLLPLAALAFRRGWLLNVVLLTGIVLPPEPVMALEWDDLWQRRDQQAARALQTEDYARAAELATDPARKGTAAYRQADYEAALQAFSQMTDANGAYNRGNSLAHLGRYQEAIEAYDEALRRQPDMEDAKANRAEVEKRLQQQQQNQQNSDSSDEEQKQDQEKEQQQSDSSQQQESKDEPRQSDEGDNNDEQQSQQEQTQQSDQQQTSSAEKQEQSQHHTEAAEETEAEPLNSEEQQAAEQWLRRIPDDPGGLLRRKFHYQYGRRPPRSDTGSDQPW